VYKDLIGTRRNSDRGFMESGLSTSCNEINIQAVYRYASMTPLWCVMSSDPLNRLRCNSLARLLKQCELNQNQNGSTQCSCGPPHLAEIGQVAWVLPHMHENVKLMWGLTFTKLL
jgi:hypothetical protein